MLTQPHDVKIYTYHGFDKSLIARMATIAQATELNRLARHTEMTAKKNSNIFYVGASRLMKLFNATNNRLRVMLRSMFHKDLHHG